MKQVYLKKIFNYDVENLKREVLYTYEELEREYKDKLDRELSFYGIGGYEIDKNEVLFRVDDEDNVYLYREHEYILPTELVEDKIERIKRLSQEYNGLKKELEELFSL